ncbi:ABC transporter ATP-binding protein, partial [Enterococcus faecium]|nr:ABC transporter ATP-binding protein [Enterococcus faecium]
MKLLNIENISKNYGDKAILENVSCEIESGEIIGLLGLNGQGKSTFVKIILDLLNKDSGHIDRFLSLKKNLGVMLQEVSLPEHLKVKELIELIRKFSDNPRTVKDALDMMDLGGFANYDCGKLSGGQKRKLQFSVAITNNPSFLVLDEPTARMDIVSKELFWTNIKKMLKMQNLTVLLISHDLLEVESVTSRIIILNNKKIVVDKKMIDLKEEFNQTKI